MAVRIESHAEPIPGYKLIERLGGGGFGEVWKAVAPGGLHKAIKFVYGDLQTASDEGMRAEQELKALSRVKTVRHPYILSLERFDIIEGQLIIVMELADRNLWDRFRECRSQGLPGIPREELLGYMDESAEALDLMNNQYQLQHLDIKPQNIFLVYNHIKVADFGLVKDLEGMVASVTGGVTPVYAAPETFDGWVSRFCDQYSLAIVYQELLTGVRPFNGTNVRQLIVQHLQAKPNLEALPPGDRPAIERALSKNPDERHPCCLDLVRALRAGEPPGPSDQAAVVVPALPSSAGDARGEMLATPQGAEDDTASSLAPPADRPAQSSAAAPPVDPLEAETPNTHSIRSIPRERRKVDLVRPAGGKSEPEAADGLLFPTLVIGLGQVGGSVLQRLRESVQEQFGRVDLLPSLRLLLLDTDPETVHGVSGGKSSLGFAPSDVLLARLNRPSHYLRSREGRTRIDTWFNLKMLYRIPRTPVTTGVRALGRLAFFDNYRLISARLKQELEACTNPEALTQTQQQTGLPIRGKQPRVYVISSLAGGTGSGMFLDLAYVLRALFRGLGYERPEMVGLFLLPEVDRQHTRALTLGNAFAALTELSYFSTAGNRFAARYDEREPALVDSAAPYDRCLLLPMVERGEVAARREVIGLAADFLYRNLVTPLGRHLDGCRARSTGPLESAEGLRCQTFGMYRLSWPRRFLLQRVGRRLCQQLVQRWMTKDSSPVRATVQEWAAEQWSKLDVGAESLIAELQKACEKALGGAPEAQFAALIEPLGGQLDSLEVAEIVTCLAEALDRLEQIVGRPDEVHSAGPTPLQEGLDKQANALVAAWGSKLAELAVRLIEQPDFRLAGAEEALRQVIATLEQVLQHHEPLAKDLATRAGEAQSRIKALLTTLAECPPGNRRIATLVQNLLELLRFYPRWRYQSLTLQRVLSTYVSLRGHLSDQLREINFCRARLGDLLNTFKEQLSAPRAEGEVGRGRSLLPAGCATLDEAIGQFHQSLGADELRELDQQMQKMIRQQFTALVHVCLTPSNLLKNLEAAMQREAEAFVAARLTTTNVVDMYLAQQGSEEEAQADLVDALDEAAPDLADARASRNSEIQVLVVPAGPAGEKLAELARTSLPKVTLLTDPHSDDIVFYREVPQVELSKLEQLGPVGYEAYRQMAAVEHLTPHSRNDITEWRAAALVAR